MEEGKTAGAERVRIQCVDSQKILSDTCIHSSHDTIVQTHIQYYDIHTYKFLSTIQPAPHKKDNLFFHSTALYK